MIAGNWFYGIPYQYYFSIFDLFFQVFYLFYHKFVEKICYHIVYHTKKDLSMNTKNIKGCIFDLDGTLLDTLEDIRAAVNRVMAENGLPILEGGALFASYLGHGNRTLLDKAFGHVLTDEEYSRIGPSFLAAYSSDPVRLSRPYEGISNLLSNLVSEGKKIAVISNKRDELTRPIVEHFFGDIPFTFVMGQREEFPLKPDPSSALYVASLMGLKPEEVAFVGDSFQDALTANNAGMIACSVLWGYQDVDEISSKASPDVLINTVDQLEAFILG
jgi:phosphoglycolate phosphatase